MSKRVLVTPGRIIISRPGFVAGPSLDDGDKVFDSNWDFSGAIIAAGTAPDPSTPITGSEYTTLSSADIVINFPDPGYVPAAYMMTEDPRSIDVVGHSILSSAIGGGGSGFRKLSPVQGTVGRGQIVINRWVFDEYTPDRYSRFHGGIHFIIFAIG